MTRLDSLWRIIVNGCFWNLLIALTHWSGIVTGKMISGLNLIVSLIMIGLVIISTTMLVNRPALSGRFRQRIWITNLVAVGIALFTEWY